MGKETVQSTTSPKTVSNEYTCSHRPRAPVVYGRREWWWWKQVQLPQRHQKAIEMPCWVWKSTERTRSGERESRKERWAYSTIHHLTVFFIVSSFSVRDMAQQMNSFWRMAVVRWYKQYVLTTFSKIKTLCVFQATVVSVAYFICVFP